VRPSRLAGASDDMGSEAGPTAAAAADVASELVLLAVGMLETAEPTMLLITAEPSVTSPISTLGKLSTFCREEPSLTTRDSAEDGMAGRDGMALLVGLVSHRNMFITEVALMTTGYC